MNLISSSKGYLQYLTYYIRQKVMLSWATIPTIPILNTHIDPTRRLEHITGHNIYIDTAAFL